MSTAREKFDWHMAQATDHVNRAINASFSDHRVGLSETEKKILEEVQGKLEFLQGRN